MSRTGNGAPGATDPCLRWPPSGGNHGPRPEPTVTTPELTAFATPPSQAASCDRGLMESGTLGDALPDGRLSATRPSAFGATTFAPADLAMPVQRIGWRLGYRLSLIGTDAATIAVALLFAQTVHDLRDQT